MSGEEQAIEEPDGYDNPKRPDYSIELIDYRQSRDSRLNHAILDRFQNASDVCFAGSSGTDGMRSNAYQVDHSERTNGGVGSKS